MVSESLTGARLCTRGFGGDEYGVAGLLEYQ